MEGTKVLWVNTGIVTTSLFKIDIPSSSKCVRFGTKLPRPKPYDEVRDSCLLGLKIEGSACSWLAGGIGTHMGSIGKQVPLPLCHHYGTSTGAGVSCLLDP